MTRLRLIVLSVAVGLLALAGTCAALFGGNSSTPTPATTTAAAIARPAPTKATTPAADPYAVYLAHNPRPDLVLSREDAQTRAMLGCGQTFAPGTIDAVLAAAYRPTGLCNGHG